MRKRRVALIIATYLAAFAAALYFCVSSQASATPTKVKDPWTSLALAAYRLPTTPSLPDTGPVLEDLRNGRAILATQTGLYAAAAAYEEQYAAELAAQEQATAEANAASSSTASTGLTSQTSTTTPTQASYSTPSASASTGGGLTFGLFPCIIIAESGGNATDHSGLYGDLDSTWAGYDGYPYAGAAPVWVQNQFNENLYNADGWAPWNDSCTGR